MASLIPQLPRPPLGLPDPLRRIHVPRDLGSVTQIGPEDPPEAGDVNSRRLLDDRHWPPTTRMEAVTSYFPTSVVALRTLKGEIMVGLAAGQAEQLSAQEPDWLINGKRGVVHYVTRNS